MGPGCFLSLLLTQYRNTKFIFTDTCIIFQNGKNIASIHNVFQKTASRFGMTRFKYGFLQLLIHSKTQAGTVSHRGATLEGSMTTHILVTGDWEEVPRS